MSGRDEGGEMRWWGWCGWTAVLAVTVHGSLGEARVKPRPRPAEASVRSVAPTISGYTSAPSSDRSIRVTDHGIGIRFQAPVTGTIAALHTYWRVGSAGCAVALQDDIDGAPGNTLASTAIADGGVGWVTAPVGVAVSAGQPYHVVLRCAGPGAGRLAYVLDGDDSARDGGAWQLEDLRVGRVRPRHRPASPLFALELTDGTWWGAPYHAMRGRSLVRIGAGNEIRATVVPTHPLWVTGVRLPRGAGASGLAYTLTASAGGMMLGGLVTGDSPAEALRAADAAPARLDAGVAYTLHVRS